MSRINLDKLNDLEFDVLKEIGNIGAGNATTALASMLQIKVDMSVPNVALLPFDELSSVVGNEEDTVVGILFQIEGDIDGMMMFIFDEKSAHHLVNTLMMRDVKINEDKPVSVLSDIEMSALNEVGNIVSGSYLNAIAGLTGLKAISSVPSLTVDMVGALLSVPAAEFGKYGDKLLMIQSQFGEEGFVTGYFLLVPELDSYDKILKSLGI